jgi:hypothetical protein
MSDRQKRQTRELLRLMRTYGRDVETFLPRIRANASLLLNGKRKDSVLVRAAFGRAGAVERLIRSDAPRREIAFEAYLLGRVAASANIENIVPDAQIGWKQREKGRRAAQARFGTPEDQRQEAVRYQVECDKVKSRSEGRLSKAAVLRNVAHTFGKSPRTVRRRLDLLKK